MTDYQFTAPYLREAHKRMKSMSAEQIKEFWNARQGMEAGCGAGSPSRSFGVRCKLDQRIGVGVTDNPPPLNRVKAPKTRPAPTLTPILKQIFGKEFVV